MEPSELPGLLESIGLRAAEAASPAVLGMARTYQRAVKYTLSQRVHTEGEFTVGGRGLPPATRSGRLRGSVRIGGGYGGSGFASASVGPNTIYAAVQEYGDVIRHERKAYMHFVNDGGEWFLKEVKVRTPPVHASHYRQVHR